MMMSSMVPVVPKNTSGPRDLRFIPTGIATNAPSTENTHVPSALQPTTTTTECRVNKTRVDYITNDSMISRSEESNTETVFLSLFLMTLANNQNIKHKLVRN